MGQEDTKTMLPRVNMSIVRAKTISLFCMFSYHKCNKEDENNIIYRN